MPSAKPWTSRPRDVFNLFNPAFCAEILRRCIFKYELECSRPFPFALIFLILPLVLDKFTREQMPLKAPWNTHFLAWLQKKPAVRVGFAKRAKQMHPFALEAFLFLLVRGAVSIDEAGNISVPNYRPIVISGPATEEIKDCYKKAEFVGKWFSEASKPETTYFALGVRP